MAFKPVGVDEQGRFPKRVEERLNTTIGTETDRVVPAKVADALAQDETIRQTATSAVEGAAEGLDLVTSTALATPATRAGSVINRSRIPAQGAVTFSWDDGLERCYRVLHKMLEQHYPNQRHNFGIITRPVLEGSPAFVTVEQVQEMADYGHEIAAHGVDSTPLATADLPTRVYEYDEGKAQLEAMIGRPVTTHVIPVGHTARNETTDRELYLRYDRTINMGTSWGGSMVPLDQRYGMFLIPRPAAWTSATHERVKAMIRQVAHMPAILNIFSHKPGDGPTGGTSGGGAADITEAEMHEVFTLVEELGLPVVTFSEAYPGQPTIANPGAEEGTAGWIPVGSGSFESVPDTPAPGMPGQRSFKLTTAPGQTVYAYQDVPALPGRSYTFSGRLRRENTQNLGATMLRVQPRDRFGDTVGGVSTAWRVPDDGEWGRDEVTIETPPGTAMIRIDMAVLQSHVGEFYVDHLHFGPTEWGSLA